MNDIKGIIEDVEKSSLVSNKVIKKVIETIGQEKWQDINDEEDDICTTAGELSITLRGIEELEKENAELKEKIKWYSEQVCNKECAEVWGQLTKAEELLKMILDWQCRCGNGHPTWQEVCAKIEQFLNSEVKK